MENPEFQEDLGSGGKLKTWIQDNIRIILSVLIVVAIASGIYSYSKRVEAPMDEAEIAMTEEGDSEESNEAITVIGEDQSEAKDQENNSQNQAPAENQQDVQNEQVKVSDTGMNQVTVSEETEDAFVETATHGDSRTVLARKALKAYLEKNNDSSLTAEHKIYIEDYLRKNVDQKSSVRVGTQMTFSKNLIKDAIEKSKTLNPHQLENLKKYSARVSSW